MSLMRKVMQLANSPQGKKMIDQGKRHASDPATRRKIQEMLAKRSGGKGGGRPF